MIADTWPADLAFPASFIMRQLLPNAAGAAGTVGPLFFCSRFLTTAWWASTSVDLGGDKHCSSQA